jgi:hypothetical protein
MHTDSPRDLPPDDSVSADWLTVQMQAGAGEPERVMMLSRAREGIVEVREWTTENWGSAPREYRATGDELYDMFEQAQRSRGRLSEELYRIRLWLDGVDL